MTVEKFNDKSPALIISMVFDVSTACVIAEVGRVCVPTPRRLGLDPPQPYCSCTADT